MSLDVARRSSCVLMIDIVAGVMGVATLVAGVMVVATLVAGVMGVATLVAGVMGVATLVDVLVKEHVQEGVRSRQRSGQI